MTQESKTSAILLIHCQDTPGIVVTITEFIHNNGGNILYLDQHVDSEHGVFFMRWRIFYEDRVGSGKLCDSAR